VERRLLGAEKCSSTRLCEILKLSSSGADAKNVGLMVAAIRNEAHISPSMPGKTRPNAFSLLAEGEVQQLAGDFSGTMGLHLNHADLNAKVKERMGGDELERKEKLRQAKIVLGTLKTVLAGHPELAKKANEISHGGVAILEAAVDEICKCL